MIAAAALLLAIGQAAAPDAGWTTASLDKVKTPPLMFFCKGAKEDDGVTALFLQHAPEKSVVDLKRFTDNGPAQMAFASPVQTVAYRKVEAGTDLKLGATDAGATAEVIVHLSSGVTTADLRWDQSGTNYTGDCTSVPLPPGKGA